MELTYPRIIYIGISVLILLFLATIISVRKYRGGRKLANVEMLKEIPYYKWLIIRYGILKFLMTVSLIASIVLALFIAAKPAEVRTVTTEKHNRDIFICFDVSTSLDGINLELCSELKKFVKNLKGERFGISIFNAKSVLVVPLTTDYDYVIRMIEKLEASIKEQEGLDEIVFGKDDIYYYRFTGVLSLDGRGSSMIGDGLATCLYDFPDLESDPEKSRLIVFVTDNDVEGEEIVNFEEACLLCANNGVKVFALAPEIIVKEKEFRHSVYLTGGDYYNTRDKDALKSLLEDVKKTDLNTTYRSVTTKKDVPEKAVIALIASMCIYFVCAWRVKL